MTALAQLAADELDVPMSRLRIAVAATGEVPDEGMTVGSMTVEMSGAALRAACAEVRALRSEEHTSELQSLMRISYAVFCLKKKTQFLFCNKKNYSLSHSCTQVTQDKLREC